MAYLNLTYNLMITHINSMMTNKQAPVVTPTITGTGRPVTNQYIYLGYTVYVYTCHCLHVQNSQLFLSE